MVLRIAMERKQRFRSRKQEEHYRFLVPRTKVNHLWSNSTGFYGKKRISALVTGREQSRRDSDAKFMERHLKSSSLSRAMYPVDKKYGKGFNPINMPILNVLAVEAEVEYGWNYPSKETLSSFPANRELS